MQTQTIDDYIDQVKTLPPVPRILVQLLDLLGKDNIDSDRVVELISFDPALTAKVIQRCNSAAFGLASPVHDISEVVMRTGFKQIFRLVAAAIGESMLGGSQPSYRIATGELWRHSAVAAVSARVIGSTKGGDEDLIFTAALLHDVGKLILGGHLASAYDQVLQETTVCGRTFVEVEQSILGVDHAEAGARLLARWNFPEDLVTAVRYHHDPRAAGEHQQLAACVFVGDAISHFIGYGLGHHSTAVRARAGALEILELTSRDVLNLILQTGEALEECSWLTEAGA